MNIFDIINLPRASGGEVYTIRPHELCNLTRVGIPLYKPSGAYFNDIISCHTKVMIASVVSGFRAFEMFPYILGKTYYIPFREGRANILCMKHGQVFILEVHQQDISKYQGLLMKERLQSCKIRDTIPSH